MRCPAFILLQIAPYGATTSAFVRRHAVRRDLSPYADGACPLIVSIGTCRRPISRPWALGYLRGVDAQGRQHHGGYIGWSYLRLDAQVVHINGTTAAGLGFRF